MSFGVHSISCETKGNLMSAPEHPDPVKVFAAVLYARDADACEVERAMEGRWGSIDHRGEVVPFDVTDYYEPEMGGGLTRSIVSFADLVAPEDIVRLKLEANTIEEEFAHDGQRTVNIDVGYFDIHKIVLASCKYDAQKVHVGSGIYADIVCRFYEGSYVPYDWTFPDFRARFYDSDFAKIRAVYKAALRER